MRSEGSNGASWFFTTNDRNKKKKKGTHYVQQLQLHSSRTVVHVYVHGCIQFAVLEYRKALRGIFSFVLPLLAKIILRHLK